MSNAITKAQDIFLEKVNLICNKLGLNNIMAQLYVVLYMSPKALSLDDMVERLMISKGSASVNIRALERYGVVRRIFVRGSRKDYYEAEADISKVIMDRINSMVQGRLSEMEDMINSSNKAINSIKPQNEEETLAVKTFKERLDRISAFYNQARSMAGLFNAAMLGKVFLNK